MTSLRKYLSCAGLIVFLAMEAASGQDLGTLRGSIKDPSGALISGAFVTLKTAASESTQTTQTGASGVFVIHDVPPGQYTLRVEHAGFASLTQVIQIFAGAMPNLDLALNLGAASTTVEVQASRDELRETLSPGTVTVVYPDDVKGEFKSVPDLLDQIPGLYVNRVSGNGQYTTVSVRGSSPTQVNIYIDGVPYNLASEAAADLSTLSISNVERIEVYRGAVPARFSGAPIGGAINIITKQPTSFKVNASAGAKTLGGRQFSIGLNGPLGHGKLLKDGKLLFGGDMERSRGDFKYTDYLTQGIQDAFVPDSIPGGGVSLCTYEENEYGNDYVNATPCVLPAERSRLNNNYSKDNLLAKWQNSNLVAKWSYLYMDRLMPTAIGSDNNERQDLLSYTPARHEQKLHQNEALVGWNDSFGKLVTSLTLNMMDQDKRYSSVNYSSYSIGGTWSHYHTRRYGAEADAVYQLGESEGVNQRFEFHADWVKETLHAGANGITSSGSVTTATGLIPLYTRFTTTAQIQDTLTIQWLHNLEITPVVRLQRLTGPTLGGFRSTARSSGNSGWQPTANIALKERFAQGWQAYASYGKYVRYPNFYEIYGDGINVIAKANSDGSTYALLPEIGRTLDAGIGWDGNLAEKLGGHGRLTYFQRNTVNNITLISLPIVAYYTNTGNTYQHGVEFEGSLHYKQFVGLQSALTVQNGWYPDNAYYGWAQTIPMVPAPGKRIPTLNAPYVTGDIRLDLHFFGDKLAPFFEVKYIGRNNIMVAGTSTELLDGSTQERYDGAIQYERPLTTLDMGAHWKISHGTTLSGGVTDLFNQGPKQTLGGNYELPQVGVSWQTCSTGGSVSTCLPYDLITHSWETSINYNVYYPQQGRTAYVTLTWQFDGWHRRRGTARGR
jgi:vitamin B12 transporter